ncbi:unnamed protein product [Vitrella brassicaformis CCMP3155]|uniref:Uncharacterized protein n=3 Tax=Vitrella brassicaformis TaxID=1169539 RepID=A0A0G4GD59_VITBC|nr:unnamed protein product [Vitrella brassicaformis CCMP3155]|eukprot:CEM27190.1 unnamed protein product [Vitrella brassicaformis CCMP3155]
MCTPRTGAVLNCPGGDDTDVMEPRLEPPDAKAPKKHTFSGAAGLVRRVTHRLAKTVTTADTRKSTPAAGGGAKLRAAGGGGAEKGGGSGWRAALLGGMFLGRRRNRGGSSSVVEHAADRAAGGGGGGGGVKGLVREGEGEGGAGEEVAAAPPPSAPPAASSSPPVIYRASSEAVVVAQEHDHDSDLDSDSDTDYDGHPDVAEGFDGLLDAHLTQSMDRVMDDLLARGIDIDNELVAEPAAGGGGHGSGGGSYGYGNYGNYSSSSSRPDMALDLSRIRRPPSFEKVVVPSSDGKGVYEFSKTPDQSPRSRYTAPHTTTAAASSVDQTFAGRYFRRLLPKPNPLIDVGWPDRNSLEAERTTRANNLSDAIAICCIPHIPADEILEMDMCPPDLGSYTRVEEGGVWEPAVACSHPHVGMRAGEDCADLDVIAQVDREAQEAFKSLK